MPRFRILLLLAPLIHTGAVSAGQSCVSASVPLALTNWNQTVTIPRFGSGLGVLTAVHVQLGAHLEGSAGVENPSPVGQVVPMQFQAITTVSRPDTTMIVSATPRMSWAPLLSAYDGVIDFGGTSGAFFPGLSVDVIPSPSVTLASALDLALFNGPAQNPGTVALTVTSMGASFATGSGPLVTNFTSRSSAFVTVCYEYQPAVTSFCPGTNTSCPCSNGGFFGEGCRHSQNSGTYLSNSGLSSISADTFVLNASTLPIGTSALFFQGTTNVGGGSGASFGDGLLCVGGIVTRLGIATAPLGVASHPAAGGTPISVTQSLSVGAARTYQAWYRDAATYCTSDTFNTSQALEVHWGP